VKWLVVNAIAKLVASTEVETIHSGVHFDVLAETENGSTIGIECRNWGELTPALGEKAARQVHLLEKGLVDRAFIVLPDLPADRQTEHVRNLEGLVKSVETMVHSEPHFQFRGGLRQEEKQSEPPRKRIFVAMPFAARFEDTYYLGIVPAAKDASAACARADEPRFDQHILEIIHRDIQAADLVVADLSDANPNVTYEMGYAHGLKKAMIHISATQPEQLPFDFRQWPILVYEFGRIHALRARLDELISAQFA